MAVREVEGLDRERGGPRVDVVARVGIADAADGIDEAIEERDRAIDRAREVRAIETAPQSHGLRGGVGVLRAGAAMTVVLTRKAAVACLDLGQPRGGSACVVQLAEREQALG